MVFRNAFPDVLHKKEKAEFANVRAAREHAGSDEHLDVFIERCRRIRLKLRLELSVSATENLPKPRSVRRLELQSRRDCHDCLQAGLPKTPQPPQTAPYARGRTVMAGA